MTKRGGYQQTAAGAFGAGEAATEAEGPEAQLAVVVGKAERTQAAGIMTDADLLRAVLATITALRTEAADVRQAALLEAAEALDAESKRIAAEADHLNRTNPDWHRRYDRACGVQDAAALLRARAATPAPPGTGLPSGEREAKLAGLEWAAQILAEQGESEGHPDKAWACDYAARVIRENADTLRHAGAGRQVATPAAPQAAGSEEPHE